MRRFWTIGRSALAAALAAAAAAGCNDNQDPVESPLVIVKTTTKSGDLQTAAPGTALPGPLRVLVTRDGQPVPQTTVAWRAQNGGTFAAASTATDDFGVASGAWTLGPNPGTQTATATVAGAQGSPQTFTATASEDGGGPPPQGVTVSVDGPPVNRFSPAEVTITVGQTVTWTWAEGALQHNVTPDDGSTPPGEDALSNAPHSYSFTFTQAGTYNYHCANHGAKAGVGMSGTVIVEPVQ